MQDLNTLLDSYVKLTLDLMSKKAEVDRICAESDKLSTERNQVLDEIVQARNGNGVMPQASNGHKPQTKLKQQNDILALLLADVGITVQRLSTLTNRSYSYCYERLRRLEEAGKARVVVPRDCREPYLWYSVEE